MVELEHRDPVSLAQVGILPFGEIFVILAPSVCCQYIRTAIGIVHGQLLVAHMLVPLGSIKFCFFQQHRIVHKISFFGNGAFEQFIQIGMIVHGCNDFSIGILIARIRFYKHHLTEEKRNVFFRRIVLIDVEVTVLDKGKMTYQNLLQIFTGQAVPALDFLQSISLCLIEYSVSAKIVIKGKIIIECVEEIVHIFFGFFRI